MAGVSPGVLTTEEAGRAGGTRAAGQVILRQAKVVGHGFRELASADRERPREKLPEAFPRPHPWRPPPKDGVRRTG